jgi:hypothetical protein
VEATSPGFFSFLIKWIQSPITTTVGLVAALVVAIAGGRVSAQRGMLFIEVGPGGGALTLGGVAWTQSGRFIPGMNAVPDALAQHESYHSRTVVALGELGFSPPTSRSARSSPRRRGRRGTT